ncbi:probable E3 ubiquitin-protein ligase XERICO [Cornus florida]|uniref:probable E3 ubiquitin-protein ligase XERICO n=1 Tax=Cornus florida TaxID=4283 RepID=UPI002899C612|nr:probable E3 ubiquitin-protein ligase XERICO [Cornus florida]
MADSWDDDDDQVFYLETMEWKLKKRVAEINPKLMPPSTDSFGLEVRVHSRKFNLLLLEESFTVRSTKYPISTAVLWSDDVAHSCFSQFLSSVGISLSRDKFFDILSCCRAMTVDTSFSTTSAPFLVLDINVLVRPVSVEEEEEEEEDHGLETVPATKSSVEALEKVRMIEGSKDQCIICLEKFEVGSEVTCMPCSHIYHEDCLVHWLELNNSCPVCRFKMPTD